MELKFTHKIEKTVLTITLLNESLDAMISSSCKEKILDLIAKTGYTKVVMDLSHLQFIDSSGLGALLAVQRELYGQGGKLKIANLSKTVQKVFDIVSMHRIFELYPTTEAAIKSF